MGVGPEAQGEGELWVAEEMLLVGDLSAIWVVVRAFFATNIAHLLAMLPHGVTPGFCRPRNQPFVVVR